MPIVTKIFRLITLCFHYLKELTAYQVDITRLNSLSLYGKVSSALLEMERVGKKSYLMLESYRNEKELFNLPGNLKSLLLLVIFAV